MSKTITGDHNIMAEEKLEHLITEKQAHDIKRLVTTIVENTEESFTVVWNKFKRKFKITSYRALSADKYEEAMSYLTQWGTATTKDLRKSNTELYRKKMYTAIYARLKDIDVTEDQLHNFLEKNFSVSSLSELPLDELDVFYSLAMKIK